MEDPVSPFTTMENSLLFRSRPESMEKSNKAPRATISICLFGVPDPKLSSELVRQVELRNATSFGKLFNFDVVRGEPIPPQKQSRVKLNVEDKCDLENYEEYNWEEKYEDDYVTRCNKHTFSSTPAGVDPPKRHSISLFVAPNILGPSSNEQSPASSPSPSSSKGCSSSKSEPLETKKPSVPRHTCHLHHHFKSVRKPCPPMVQQIITKYTYTNRVLRQAMKKPRHSLANGKSGHPRLRVCRC